MPSSIVRNLKTGREMHYTLPPREALVNAWFQQRGNWNWWNYNPANVPIEEGKKILLAGDLCVRKEG